MDPATGEVAEFTTGAEYPRDLEVSRDGSLYVLGTDRGVYEIRFTP